MNTQQDPQNPVPTVTFPVVSTSWLAEHLDSPGVVVLCASMGDAGRSQESGIPGALLADIDADFSDTNDPRPHTVPADLHALLEGYGISDETAVVVYDRHGLMVAPRVWWLLRVAGLDNVAVLDGGLPAWVAAGGVVEPLRGATPESRGTITAAPRPELLVDAKGVERAQARTLYAVVDARSAGRFSGVDEEPRPGLKRGHIPGSVNIPFTSVVNDAGLLRSPEELRKNLNDVSDGAEKFVFSCGSGVTACVDALAAVAAGYEDVVVYDGSWAEWGDPANAKPIA